MIELTIEPSKRYGVDYEYKVYIITDNSTGS